MKYIVKELEPIEFTNWKNSDKMYLGGNPKWNRLPSDIKDILRDKISKEQGYICCYCERELIKKDFHLEHIMPKEGFPKKQLEYDNLLCSCQLELEKGEPRHCGNSKGSWYKEDDFISPLNPDCEGKFKYTFDGHIEQSDVNDRAAIITIEKLQLYIDKLNAMRRAAIAPFIDENITTDDLKNLVDGYLLDKTNNNGRYNEFFTTIKYLFGN